MTAKFKPKSDAILRKRFFVPESLQHPAKMHLGLFQEILSRYEVPAGSWLLDPMGGSGTTLIACCQGINVIINELESHFVHPARLSWANIQQQGPMLGCQMGQALIMQGDARMLPLVSADCVVTSPPYADMADGLRHPGTGLEAKKGFILSYNQPVSSIITSPPYEEALTGGGIAIKGHYSDPKLANRVYSKRVMDGPGVDAVVSSPPYEHGLGADDSEGPNAGADEKRYGRFAKKTAALKGDYADPHRQGRVQSNNIGNLRRDKYWEAMTEVYRECHRVLAPGGLIALVVKGYTRKGQYIDLPKQTGECLERLGFQVFDEWARELYHLSFWRILQQKNGTLDDRLRYEWVIAARKVG